MKLCVQQHELERGLNYLQKAIPSRPQLPVLAALLLTVTEESCTLAATDLYFGVRVAIQTQVQEPGIIAIPGREFREIIQSLPATAEIELTFSDTTLTLTANKMKCTLQCLDSSDYPAFPELDGETIPVAADSIQSVVTYVSQAASLDQARPLLTGILFTFQKNTIRCVATDGFRLAIFDSAITSSITEELVVPAKIIIEASRIISHLQVKEVAFIVSKNLKQVYCKAQGVELFMRLLEGEYPPYQKILPAQFATELVVPAEALTEQVKRGLIYSRDSSSVVTLTLSDSKCVVSAQSSSLGLYQGEIESAQMKGADISISFKAKYLLEFLNTVSDSDVWIGMNESLKPALFKAQKIAQLQYVVMPFRVT